MRDGVVPDGARALLSKAAVSTASPDVNAAPKESASPTATAAPAVTAAPSAAPIVTPAAHAGPRLVWRDVVAPLLAARCASCHGDAKQKGKLRVDSIEALVAGGKGGPAIVPGNPSGGTLLARSHLPVEDDKHMPPAKEPQLDAAQVELIAWWIGQGARATDTASAMPSRFSKMAAVSAASIRTPIAPMPPASASASAEPSSPPAPPAVAGPVDVYAELIAPILRKRCGECHLGEHAMGGLHVDNYDKMVAELDIVPGKPEQSSLVKRMLLPMSNDDRMPPSDKPQATAAEIEAVRAWIARGARRNQTVDAHELPPELLGAVERKPAGADKGAVAVNAPPADAVVPVPGTTPPPAVPPAGAKGCATCSVGGDVDRSAAGLSLAVAGVLTLAYGARRSRRRSRR